MAKVQHLKGVHVSVVNGINQLLIGSGVDRCRRHAEDHKKRIDQSW
jgi:hypothetical protein